MLINHKDHTAILIKATTTRQHSSRSRKVKELNRVKIVLAHAQARVAYLLDDSVDKREAEVADEYVDLRCDCIWNRVDDVAAEVTSPVIFTDVVKVVQREASEESVLHISEESLVD
jgi:hypothetical protein